MLRYQTELVDTLMFGKDHTPAPLARIVEVAQVGEHFEENQPIPVIVEMDFVVALVALVASVALAAVVAA